MTRPPWAVSIPPDPGPWQAGVDDAPNPQISVIWHTIRDNLSYSHAIFDFVLKLRRPFVPIDIGRASSRYSACLLANAGASANAAYAEH